MEHETHENCWCKPVQDSICKDLWIHNRTEINGKFEADVNLSEQSQMVEDCEKRESKLTDWERDFIDSLAARLCRGNGITDKQADKLLKIWERITS